MRETRLYLTVLADLVLLCSSSTSSTSSSNFGTISTSTQGCIIRSILPFGMGARGVSSEHVENMEMFSCSAT